MSGKGLLESIIKNKYDEWIKAPVLHNQKSFIRLLSEQLKTDEKNIKSKLKSYSWFNLK